MSKVIYEKRGITGSLVVGIVDCVLNNWKKGTPCVWELAAKAAQNIFHHTIDTFRLSIGFRMARRRHVQPRAKRLKEMFPERSCKARVTIGNKIVRQSMEFEHVFKKETGCLFGADLFTTWCEVHYLRKSTDKDKNAGLSLSVLREAKNEIHADT